MNCSVHVDHDAHGHPIPTSSGHNSGGSTDGTQLNAGTDKMDQESTQTVGIIHATKWIGYQS